MYKRWEYEIAYRRAKCKRYPHGVSLVGGTLEELADLHDVIERGPHFDTVKSIKIKRINHVSGKRLTVEKAKKL